MTDESGTEPSVWDDLLAEMRDDPDDFDFDAYTGEPPDWYYPLVGKVAVTMGGLERAFALTGLRLLHGLRGPGAQLGFWLQSTSRLDTLLSPVKGVRSDFDDLVKELPQARQQRGEVVPVYTGWHDFEAPDQWSGWHYEHPRTGRPVYLGAPGTRPALERVLERIANLDRRVWDLYAALEQLPGKADPGERGAP